eukprot:UN32160
MADVLDKYFGDPKAENPFKDVNKSAITRIIDGDTSKCVNDLEPDNEDNPTCSLWYSNNHDYEKLRRAKTFITRRFNQIGIPWNPRIRALSLTTVLFLQ